MAVHRYVRGLALEVSPHPARLNGNRQDGGKHTPGGARPRRILGRLRHVLNSQVIKRFIRYCAWGLIVLCADLTVYLLLSHRQVHYMVSHLAARTLGLSVSFVGHKFWSFESKSIRTRVVCAEGWRFAALCVVNYVVSSALVLLLKGMAARPIVARYSAEAATLAMSFALMYFWVFRPARSASARGAALEGAAAHCPEETTN